MQYYRIENWAENYEHEKRVDKRPKNIKWIAVKTTFDGRLLKKLLRHPEPARVFGIAIIMAELAAAHDPEHRGKLVSSDLSTGYSAEDMSLKTGFPVEDFLFAIPILIEIKWISFYDDFPKISETLEKNRLHNSTRQDITVQPKKSEKSSTFDFLNKITELNYPDRKKEYFEILNRIPELCQKIDPLNVTDETPKIIGAVFFSLHHFYNLRQKYPKLDWVELVNSKFKRGFTVWAVAGMLWKISKLKEPPHDFYAYCESLGKDQKVITDVWELEIWPVVKADKIKLPA